MDGYSRERPASTCHGQAVGQPVIRVVGVGGAGVNAVNRMVEAEVEGVEFLAVNTDLQSLQQSTADITLHIGAELTRGLGSGSDANIGRQAAMEDYDRVKALLKGSDMIFITAGAGGGTGTGAAPIVARIAREVGALTVAIVTKPFGFEGSRRGEQAEQGVSALAEEVDTLIVVPNNRLLAVLDKQTAMVEAFRVADDVLRQGVQGISDLVTLPGLINLDFADVRTIMTEAGNALLGIGMGVGENRATEAAMQAVASPLLETSMDGARSILLSITGGNNLSLWEVNEAAKAVSEAAHPDANIIFGAMVDEKLDDQVWVTVVATGYGDEGRRKSVGRLQEPAGEPSRSSERRTRHWRPDPRRGGLRWMNLKYPSSSPRLRQPDPARPAPRRLCYRSAMGEAEKGVVAAGHPLTGAGRREVLREGGNAVDAAVAAMLTSFAAEPLLTGLGAGGYMLVAGAGRSRRCWTSSCRRRPISAGDGSGAELEAIDVSFGDAAQVFHIGPGLVRRVRHAGGRVRGGEAMGDRPAGGPGGAGGAARAGGRRAERRAGVRGQDPRRAAELHARVRGAVGAGGPHPARGRAAAQPRAGRRAAAPGRGRRRALLPGRRGDGGVRLAAARGGSLSCEDLAGYRAIEREPVKMGYRDREVLTNPPPSAGGTLLAYALALLDRGPAPPTLSGVVEAMAAAQSERTPEFVEGLERGGLSRALPRHAAGGDDAHLGARRRGLRVQRHLHQRRGLGRGRAGHGDAPQQRDGRGGPEPARLSPPSRGTAHAEHDGPLDRDARR